MIVSMAISAIVILAGAVWVGAGAHPRRFNDIEEEDKDNGVGYRDYYHQVDPY
jgi:hypothetical protein